MVVFVLSILCIFIIISIYSGIIIINRSGSMSISVSNVISRSIISIYIIILLTPIHRQPSSLPLLPSSLPLPTSEWRRRYDACRQELSQLQLDHTRLSGAYQVREVRQRTYTQTHKQASTQTSKHTSKQARKQASTQTSKHANKGRKGGRQVCDRLLKTDPTMRRRWNRMCMDAP